MKNEICKCGHDKKRHKPYTERGECIFTNSSFCSCKKFEAKTVGILEMAKRIKDEDRENEKQKGCGKFVKKTKDHFYYCGDVDGELLCPKCKPKNHKEKLDE